jgi:murein DD-endopeptidase MepM/ murein hydrolase activator NlpD
MGGMMTAAQVERRDARYRAALAALNREVAAAKDQLGELQRLKDAYARLALPRAHRAPPASTAAAESASGEGGPALSLTPGASGGAGTRGALSEDLASTGERVGRLTAFLATLREQWNSEFASIDHLPTAPPLPGGYTFTSRFGTRVDPFTGQPGRHEGIDLAAPAGTPIFAAAAGIVVRAGSDPDYGNVVDIDHGNGYVTRYGHARRLYVKVGQRVERGARIAEVGSTGRSTAPHLHFEVRLHHRPENPLLFQHVPG